METRGNQGVGGGERGDGRDGRGRGKERIKERRSRGEEEQGDAKVYAAAKRGTTKSGGLRETKREREREREKEEGREKLLEYLEASSIRGSVSAV